MKKTNLLLAVAMMMTLMFVSCSKSSDSSSVAPQVPVVDAKFSTLSFNAKVEKLFGGKTQATFEYAGTNRLILKNNSGNYTLRGEQNVVNQGGWVLNPNLKDADAKITFTDGGTYLRGDIYNDFGNGYEHFIVKLYFSDNDTTFTQLSAVLENQSAKSYSYFIGGTVRDYSRQN
jgi:hypothetical protein